MQYACAILCPAVHYFSTLSHERHDFRKENLWAIKFVSTLSTTLSEMFFIIGRIERNVIEMYTSLHVKYPLFLPDFHET